MVAVGSLLRFAGSAQAACHWEQSFSSGTEWGLEDSQWPSTCDGALDYYGRVKDILPDGYSVDIAYKHTLNGSWYYTPYSTGAWRNFSYTDSDSFVYFRICRFKQNPFVEECSVTGTNYGF